MQIFAGVLEFCVLCGERKDYHFDNLYFLLPEDAIVPHSCPAEDKEEKEKAQVSV